MCKKKFQSILKVGLKSLFIFVLVIVLSSINLQAQMDGPCDKGMAKLCISVSAMDEPCKIDNIHRWYIAIFNCDGTLLEFCGRKYFPLPTRCGCLEVTVPPGCYYVKAVWGFWLFGHKIYWCNHFTDAAIVQAGCEKTTCVRLFNPSIHRCGIIYAKAVNDLVKQKGIKPELVKQVMGAVEAVNRLAPPPQNKFELGIEQEIEELMKKEHEENK